MHGWTEHVIWWHVYPLGFTGAERRPPARRNPGCARLEPWLDYLLELGCNGLALGPVFASEHARLRHVDHFGVDPRLGTDDDLRGCSRPAGRTGSMSCSTGSSTTSVATSRAFLDVLEHGPASRWARWFDLDFGAGTGRTASATATSRATANWWRSTTRARGDRLHRRGDGALARRRRERLAAGRRVRDPAARRCGR